MSSSSTPTRVLKKLNVEARTEYELMQEDHLDKLRILEHKYQCQWTDSRSKVLKYWRVIVDWMREVSQLYRVSVL